MKKILIVEDDKYLMNAYRVKLTKSGFEVRLAMDGAEAMIAVPDFQPDLILLDIVMPKKDGFSVLEDLKQHAEWKKIPVIITSNLGQKEDIEKGMQLGAKDYIIKSDIAIADVITKINKALG